MQPSVVYKVDNEHPAERKRFVRGMFDSIVPTYDLLNHLLSFGTDVVWRHDLARATGVPEGGMVIDLCCGTGDVSRLLERRGIRTVSLDFSGEMLKKGIEKKALGGTSILGDACLQPLKSGAFDGATIAFGIRNIPDLDRFMREVHRVLKPGGKLTILELVRPESRTVGAVYSFYLRKLLPAIGGVLSGKPGAYRYLSGPIATFVAPGVIQEMLEKHGFTSVTRSRKTFGVAVIFSCRKGPG